MDTHPPVPFLEVSARAAITSPASKWRVVLGAPHKMQSTSVSATRFASGSGAPATPASINPPPASTDAMPVHEPDAPPKSAALVTAPKSPRHEFESPDRVYALVEPLTTYTSTPARTTSRLTPLLPGPAVGSALVPAKSKADSLKCSATFMLVQTLRPPTPVVVVADPAADADDVPPEANDVGPAAAKASPPSPLPTPRGARPTSAEAAVAAFAARRALTSPPKDPVRVIVPAALVPAVVTAAATATKQAPLADVFVPEAAAAFSSAPFLEVPLCALRDEGYADQARRSEVGAGTDHRRTPICASSASVVEILSPHFDLSRVNVDNAGSPTIISASDSLLQGPLPSISTFITKDEGDIHRPSAAIAGAHTPYEKYAHLPPSSPEASSSRNGNHLEKASTAGSEEHDARIDESPRAPPLLSPPSTNTRHKASTPARRAPAVSPAVALLSLPRLRQFESQRPIDPSPVRDLLPRFSPPSSVGLSFAGCGPERVADAFAAPLSALERWVDGAKGVVSSREVAYSTSTGRLEQCGPKSPLSSVIPTTASEPLALPDNRNGSEYLHYSPRFGVSLHRKSGMVMATSDGLPLADAVIPSARPLALPETNLSPVNEAKDRSTPPATLADAASAPSSSDTSKADAAAIDAVTTTALEAAPLSVPLAACPEPLPAVSPPESAEAESQASCDVDNIVKQLLSFTSADLAPVLSQTFFSGLSSPQRLVSSRSHLRVAPLSYVFAPSSVGGDDSGCGAAQAPVAAVPSSPPLIAQSGMISGGASISPTSQSTTVAQQLSAGTLQRATSMAAKHIGGSSSGRGTSRHRAVDVLSEQTPVHEPPEVTAQQPLRRELSPEEVAAARAAAQSAEALARSLHVRAAAGGYGSTARQTPAQGGLSERRYGGTTARGSPSARSVPGIPRTTVAHAGTAARSGHPPTTGRYSTGTAR